MKRAIVLSGGGSLGAYELGVWRALRHLNVDYRMVTGTSIGAINATMMAQGDFELAEQLWTTITIDQVMVDGMNMYLQLEKYLDKRAELRAFIKRFAHNHGADVTPLLALLHESIDEQAVRESGIELGLITVRYPTLSPVELMLSEIPEGQLVDYVMASAACFPAFPVHRIGEAAFIDGSFYDNLPVGLALAHGAEEVVAVDLYAHSFPEHPEMIDRPWMTFVRPSQALGSILLFDRPVLDRNMMLGELDTLRAFGRVLGVRYSFDADSCQPYQGHARRFSLRTVQLEDQMMFRRALTRKVAGTPLSNALRRALPSHKTATDLDELLVAAGYLAEWTALESIHLYTLDEFNKELFAALPLELARIWIENADERELAGIHKLEPALASTVLAYLLRRGGLDAATVRAAARRVESLLAACYLEQFLPE